MLIDLRLKMKPTSHDAIPRSAVNTTLRRVVWSASTAPLSMGGKPLRLKLCRGAGPMCAPEHRPGRGAQFHNGAFPALEWPWDQAPCLVEPSALTTAATLIATSRLLAQAGPAWLRYHAEPVPSLGPRKA